MSFLSGFKIRAALLKHQKGDNEGALSAYKALYDSGIIRSTYILPYSVLLLREGGEENYERVKQILIKAQKASDLNPQRKQQLFINYSVACWKTGEKDRAIQLMEASHRELPSGLTYNTLGFFYVEAGDAEKALPFNLEALEYDDTDPITLDNLAQTYYRLLNDKETAKQYFDKAHEIKPEQIDTLYFLAQYDLDNNDKEAALEKLTKAAEGRFSPLNFITRERIQSEIDQLKAGE